MNNRKNPTANYRALLLLLDAFLATFALVIGGFYLTPDNYRYGVHNLVIQIIPGLALVCYLLFVILPGFRQTRKRFYRVGLIIISPCLITLLAELDWILSRMNPDNFYHLVTKWDALYFTIVTMATVGYGDIYPRSQSARIWVGVQIIIGVAFIAFVVQREIASTQTRPYAGQSPRRRR